MKLSADGLCKRFGARTVVRDVRLELVPGEIVGLLGPNGAGKTTTFHMVTGFLRPDAGRILFDATEITRWPVHARARKGIGYLPQKPSVFRKLTVRQNVVAILELLGWPGAEIGPHADRLLDQLEIRHLADQSAGTLSGGERRRVELARALAPRPTFLLLDEPFTGIDPIVRAQIQEILRRLRTGGLGILITDHNVRETLQVTDRAYLMYDAQVLMEGSAAHLIKSRRARELYLGRDFRI